MADLQNIDDSKLIEEISRRFNEKSASIKEMEFMTKKLLDLNEKAKAAEEIKSRFLSLIKNEFNNPMSTLLSLSKKLVDKKNPERVQEIEKLINEEIIKMDFHLKNIFSASEIEAGEISSDFSTVSIKAIYNDAVVSLKYLIEEKNLGLEFSEGEDLELVTDASKLYMILLNLLSNACEFSYPNSKVKLRVKEVDGEFYMEVEDFGEGISVDFHNEVFNRFSRQSSGKTRATSGLGLGLSIVRALAESLDGSIKFDTKEGNTVFTLSLPKLADDIATNSSQGSNEFLFDDFDDFSEDSVEL